MITRMRAVIGLIFLLFMPAILSACGTVSSAGDVAGEGELVKIASVVASNTPSSRAIREAFIPYIEEQLPGEYNIQIYDSGVLGSESASYAYTKTGIVELSLLGSSMWSETPVMASTDFPFMFRDVEHARRAYQGELGDFIAEELNAAQPVTLLSWLPNGSRAFSSNQSLETIDDFQGQRMRMPNNPIHVRLAEALGANVVIMDLGEVFTALEQGVADGQDNPIATLRNEGWYEIQDYIYNTNHMVASLHLFASDYFLAELPEDHRQVFEEAALLASDYAWDLYIEQLDEDIAFVEEQGVTVTELTPEDRERFIEMLQPVYDYLDSQYDWAEDIREMVDNIE